MGRLRANRANKGNIYDLKLKKKQQKNKENRVIALDKRVVKNKLSKSSQWCIDNITILNTSKRTVTREFLKFIRGT